MSHLLQFFHHYRQNKDIKDFDDFWDLSDDQDILPSEAVFGFISWLTTRPGTLKIGEKHSCSELLDLICDWCDVNYLIPPREKNYPNNIAFPIEKK